MSKRGKRWSYPPVEGGTGEGRGGGETRGKRKGERGRREEGRRRDWWTGVRTNDITWPSPLHHTWARQGMRSVY